MDTRRHRPGVAFTLGSARRYRPGPFGASARGICPAAKRYLRSDPGTQAPASTTSAVSGAAEGELFVFCILGEQLNRKLPTMAGGGRPDICSYHNSSKVSIGTVTW